METFRWKTDYYHADNNTTMLEYLDLFLPEDAIEIMVDGTYAEIERDGVKYAVHASGDGDSFNHKVEFEEL
jgi:hypothetical protein